MALRVLLADESTTIKKVMQLALQDFAVDVKAVHSGVDVLEVARQFQPDIIFVDILLQKKNGYEVTVDLKNDAQLRTMPVVLMWSSFMELDEMLAKRAAADARLEKPFDVENLRQVVLKLVPKTHSQRLAHFLKYPDEVAQPLKEEIAGQARPPSKAIPQAPVPPPTAAAPPPPPPPPTPAAPKVSAPTAPKTPPPDAAAARSAPAPSAPPPPPTEKTATTWSMDSFDDIANFAHVEGLEAEDVQTEASADEGIAEFKMQNLQEVSRKTRPRNAPARHEPGASDDAEPWSHQDLSRFKIDLPPVEVEGEEFALKVDPHGDDLETTGIEPHHGEPAHSAAGSHDDLADPFGSGLELIGDDSPADDEYMPLNLAQSGLSLADDSAPALGLSFQDESPATETGFAIEETAPQARRPAQSESLASRIAAAKTGMQGDPGDLVSGAIPPMTPERLEQIVRAQSREIIESVVRKIVPDIASELIREELHRLLEDSGLHDRP